MFLARALGLPVGPIDSFLVDGVTSDDKLCFLLFFFHPPLSNSAYRFLLLSCHFLSEVPLLQASLILLLSF